MISALDILYIVLAICAVIVSVVLVMLGLELIGAIRDVRRISNNVEHMASLIDRVAMIIFPGMERMAKGADSLERKVAAFLERKADKLK